MSDSAAKIVRLERQVMWRNRLLSLQDELAISVMIGALIAAALVLLMNLRPIAFSRWAVIAATMSLSVAVALIRWFVTRARQRDAAFLIDQSFKLDDRVATSISIIERGGPRRPVEDALIEDTAARVASKTAASVVPFAVRRWHAFSLISVIVLTAVLMIPTPSFPTSEPVTSERADIESAGEHLEQTAAEIEQVAPSGTETAALAKEQAEVGRGFRLSPATRTEALRRLSALEERIRHRRDDLASTRAEEIVDLADRRLGATLSTLSTARRKTSEPNESEAAGSIEPSTAVSKRDAGKQEQPPATGSQPTDQPSQMQRGKSDRATSRTQTPPKALDQSDAQTTAKEPTIPESQKGRQEPVSSNQRSKNDSSGPDSKRPNPQVTKSATGEPAASNEQKPADQRTGNQASDRKPSDQTPSDQKPAGVKNRAEQASGQSGAEQKTAEQQPNEQPAGALEALKAAVPDSLAEQAAKAVPKLSAELLKKAAELRANELTPADIEKLRKAAEWLARDLSQIGQSKELQQALQEMARDVRPDQIEQVARELAGQEKLRQELEAAARLLAENQQAKQMAAGLSSQFSQLRAGRPKTDSGQPIGKAEAQDGGTRNQDSASTRGKGSQTLDPMKPEAEPRLAARGRESSLKGKLRQGSGGEYLYLQSKAGVGAARVPYSSAYPQYRRAAERSVHRSQVPPNLRSAVRKYFDAINPDARR